MNSWLMALALLVVSAASAGNTWITLHDGTRELVTELGPGGPVTVLAHANTMAFGESPTQVAIVSYDQAAAQNQLRLFDKQTRQLLATWPLPATPVSLLSGAAPDVVLLDGTAYVLTHATTLAASTALTRNARGGSFNVVKVALRTGEIAALPLNNEFFNPRLCNFGGVPVVTDWAGYAVWRLAPGGREMTAVIGTQHLSDILPAERTDQARRTMPYNARADSVAVPRAGVFRLSKFGLLHRIAGPDLEPLPAPHDSLALGPAQNKELLLAVTSAKGPAIAVVRRDQDKRTLAFIDASTLSVSWERELSPGVSVWSMAAAGPDAVIYIDKEKRALMQLTRDGTSVLTELPAERRYESAHIISAGTH
jgi:hypothetical protein